MSTPTRRPSRLLGALAVATLLLTACGEDEPREREARTVPPPVVSEPEPEVAGSPSEPPREAGPDAAAEATREATAGAGPEPNEESTDPAELPPFEPAGTPQQAEPSGELLLPVDLRVGEHHGFDRVVVELSGEGVPGWQTEYVTSAVEDGRGNRIDVDGDAVLSVHVTGTRYPEENEDHYARTVVEGPDVVEEVHYVGTFEGRTQLFIGVDDGLADYRVLPLANPARLVIDIADPDD